LIRVAVKVDGWRYAMIGDADPAALCAQVIRTFGKLDDGVTDDPQALAKAIASVLSEPSRCRAGPSARRRRRRACIPSGCSARR